MATVFLSYSLDDTDVVKALETKLREKGHDFRISVGTPPVGQWRARLMQALRNSDALVSVLSGAALTSPYVLCELGSGLAFDATKDMLVLPVVFAPDFRVPYFISDYHCLHLPSEAPNDVKRLADEIHRALTEHADAFPRVFVSHRHHDKDVAEALVELLEAAFVLTEKDIRCTSVHPYMLPPGARTSDRLRAELGRADVVLGLVTPSTTESNYVVAELGAAWGRSVATFPLLARGGTFQDVPEPLDELTSISLEEVTNSIHLIDSIRKATLLTRRNDSGARVSEKANRLAELAGTPGAKAKKPKKKREKK